MGLIIYPCWYVHDLIQWAGWNKYVWRNHVILWNFDRIDERCLLTLKFLDKKIFVAVIISDTRTSRSIEADSFDLLNFTIARRIIASVYKSNLLVIDDKDSVKNLRIHLDSVKPEPDYQFLAKELQYAIRKSKVIRNTKRTNDLIDLYQSYFSEGLAKNDLAKTEISSINYVGDNADVVKEFRIDKDTVINVYAQGHVMHVSKEWKKWNADMAELFFYNELIDAKGNKYPNSKVASFYFNDTAMFRSYKVNNISIASYNTGGANYQIEVAIPWSNWEIKSISAGVRIPTEVKVSDFDINRYNSHGFVRWLTAKSIKENLKHNEIRLVNKYAKSNSPNFYPACYLGNKITVDGKMDKAWQNSSVALIDSCFNGKIVGKSDLDAKFRCGWNKEALYFFFNIRDNVNISTDTLGVVDRCWIEDIETGEGIWELKPSYQEELFPAISVKETIYIPKGRYKLCYTSNGLYSYQSFIGENPKIDNYGIKLFYHDNQLVKSNE